MGMERDEENTEASLRDADEIGMSELSGALCGLVMLGDDPFLRMQATNIALIDKWLMSLEVEGLRARARDEHFEIAGGVFLNAQSQMWLFAVYELLRTWRERAKKIRVWVDNGGLSQKIASLRQNTSVVHVSNSILADLLARIATDPSVAAGIEDDLARTHVVFHQLEFLRVALAKHEVSGRPKRLANAPGHARLNMWTGSMSYELSNGAVILDEMTRRDFADGLRNIAVDRAVPSPDDLASFDAYMKLSETDSPF